jgi:hypothetical protein
MLHHLFCSPIDLVQESAENLFLQNWFIPGCLINFIDERRKLTDSLLFIFFIPPLDANLLEDLFHPLLALSVLLPVVIAEDLPLPGRRVLESDIDVPATFVIEDVGADLANELGRAVTIEVIVLDLEVFAEGNEDLLGVIEEFGVGYTGHVHTECDRKVEGVEGSFVNDDELMSGI